MPLTPIQKEFFTLSYRDSAHWNLFAKLYRRKGWESVKIERIFKRLMCHHDALRMIYKKVDGEMKQINRGQKSCDLIIETFDLTEESNIQNRINEEANKLHESLDLLEGPLLKIAIFNCRGGDYLLIIIHHLIIDGISWRILLEDFNLLYQDEQAKLPPKTTSYQTWANQLVEYSSSKEIEREISYWKKITETKVQKLPKDKECEEKYFLKDSNTLRMILDEENTNLLLTKVHHAYKTEINDLLLAALMMMVQDWTGYKNILINLEGHGREELEQHIDISRTIGWFTSVYPVVLDIQIDKDISDKIKEVKEILRRIPNKGIGYGILRYLSNKEKKINPTTAEISFNYLGQFEEEEMGEEIVLGDAFSLESHSTLALDINGFIQGGKLQLEFTYNAEAYHLESINTLMRKYRKYLIEIIEHCVEKDETDYTPSDFSTSSLDFEDLEDVLKLIEG
ncbi:MAG: condensation domain-containing protein [Niallia nealsonii]|nr:condensation domain-containing protein [Niallia nealsonii]